MALMIINLIGCRGLDGLHPEHNALRGTNFKIECLGIQSNASLCFDT